MVNVPVSRFPRGDLRNLEELSEPASLQSLLPDFSLLRNPTLMEEHGPRQPMSSPKITSVNRQEDKTQENFCNRSKLASPG